MAAQAPYPAYKIQPKLAVGLISEAPSGIGILR